jgi:hypothetical protein
MQYFQGFSNKKYHFHAFLRIIAIRNFLLFVFFYHFKDRYKERS